MFRVPYLLLMAVLLNGCISAPTQQTNLSLSELSERIERSDGEPVHVESKPTYGSHAGASVTHVSNEFTSYNNSLSSSDIRFDRSAVLLTAGRALNRDNAPYSVGQSYGVAWAGTFASQQVRAGIAIADVDFIDSKFDAFKNPILANLDLDYRWLMSANELSYFVGARISFGLFGYGLDSPVVIDSTEYSRDSIGYFGLGVPIGMQMDIGHFVLEAAIVPTVHFFSQLTDAGFINDVFQANTVMPFNFGLGYAF